ncbi:hypothetical protein Btru_042515, partial [Bulinus truncatus]
MTTMTSLIEMGKDLGSLAIAGLVPSFPVAELVPCSVVVYGDPSFVALLQRNSSDAGDLLLQQRATKTQVHFLHPALNPANQSRSLISVDGLDGLNEARGGKGWGQFCDLVMARCCFPLFKTETPVTSKYFHGVCGSAHAITPSVPCTFCSFYLQAVVFRFHTADKRYAFYFAPANGMLGDISRLSFSGVECWEGRRSQLPLKSVVIWREEDITFMCSMLNMADSVNEVRHQLGLIDNSKISFDDFLRCRTRVMLESNVQRPQHLVFHNITSAHSPALLSGEDTGIESDASGMMGSLPANKLTSWPTLSSDSLGALSCTKPDSADYDSGARDLSPEPTTMSLTQLMETHDPYAFKQLRDAGADSLLEIANRLHAAALTSLKGEVFELKNHILRLATERAVLDSGHPHRYMPSDAKLGPVDFEERLEELTSRYEERIIELHSVIAELRKKLERHQINVIREEDEFEESDQGQSVHSVDGESIKDENNEICQEFSRAVSELQTAMAKKPVQTSQGSDVLMSSSYTVEEADEKKDEVGHSFESPPKLPPRMIRPNSLTSTVSVNFDPQFKSEMLALKTDNEELRRQTSNLEIELGQMSEQMGTCMKEKEILMKKVLELQQKLHSCSSPSHSRVVTPTKQAATPPPLVE